MYARGMSQRDISATIDDIYGFKLSAEQISKITDYASKKVGKIGHLRCLQYLRHSGRQAQGNFGTLDLRQRDKFSTSWKVEEYNKSDSFQWTGFLIRNSLKYVPTRDYKDCTAHLKKIYGVPSIKGCRVEFMYTTNAIEAVNSSFRKVTKRGAFPNDNSVFKLLYLRVVELQKKWASRPFANWSLVRNQLLLNDRLSTLFDKFDR